MVGTQHIRGRLLFATLVATVVLASGLAVAAPAAAPSTPPAKTMAGVPAEAKPVTADADKTDINTASKAELSKLPGIGDAYSRKIIDGRPYKAKNELESKKILPKSVYEGIAPMIIARQKK